MRTSGLAMAILVVLIVACGPTAAPELLGTPATVTPQVVPTRAALASPAAPSASPAPPSASPLAPPASPALASPTLAPTVTPTPRTSPTPRPTSSPTSRPTATPSPSPEPVELSPPLLVDSEAGRLYMPGRWAGESQIVALSAADGALLAAYRADGPFALDPANGWLYVDRGDEGLVVFDVDDEAVQATIPLPEATLGGWLQPAPQAHPRAGQGLAFRDNVVYLVDPVAGEVVHSFATSVQIYNSDVLPIGGAIFDSSSSLLYLFYSYSPAFRYRYTLLVSYDLDAETEIARQQFSQTDPTDMVALAAGGTLYGLTGHWFAGPGGSASFWTWAQGEPRFTSRGWIGTVSPGLQFDAPRQRLYAATDTSLLLLDAPTLALSAVVPRPAEGELAGFDPVTDQLYFLTGEGGLQVRPAGAVQPSGPEPLVEARLPAHPVRALAASPSEGDNTLFGIWQAGTELEDAMVLGRAGGLLYLGQVGEDGGTWYQARAGLPGEGRLSVLALSPAYVGDETLLVSVVGLGIFRSTDGGGLWRPASAGLETMSIHELLLSPAFAADGTAFACAPFQLLHRSRDRGRTWEALAMEPYLLALSAEFDQDATLLAVLGAYPYREVHLSRDGGDGWERVGETPNESPLTALSLAPLFARWQVAFAYEEDGRLYRSTDGGRNWHSVLETGLTPSAGRLLYVPGVEANRPVFLLVAPRYDPTYTTTTGYVPAEPPTWAGRLYRSSDGGLTWAQIELPGGLSPTAMALSPTFAQDRLLYLGTASGGVHSLDTSTLVGQQ
jgi:photosystem II stability/assembly factor-like uncharacterized protein